MANIINQTFFVGNIYLPNLSHTAELGRLTTFINKFEPECLCKILGYPLYKKFGEETSQRMTDLLSGAEYTDGLGETKKFNGLKHDTVISLIANYVYFYIMQDNASQQAGTGTNVPVPNSATQQSPKEKQVSAWNFFSDEVQSMIHFLWLKKDGNGVRVYPEFSYYQYCETRRITRRIDALIQI